MLPYANLLSNGKNVQHGTDGVDTAGCYCTHICSEMRHTYYMAGYMIDMPV